MARLTDFELAALAAVPGVAGGLISSVTDIVWAFKDYDHSGLSHLMPVAASLATTVPLFVVSGWLLYKAWRRHLETSRKPIQSKDDVDYRISLALSKREFKKYCCKEEALKRRG